MVSTKWVLETGNFHDQLIPNQPQTSVTKNIRLMFQLLFSGRCSPCPFQGTQKPCKSWDFNILPNLNWVSEWVYRISSTTNSMGFPEFPPGEKKPVDSQSRGLSHSNFICADCGTLEPSAKGLFFRWRKPPATPGNQGYVVGVPTSSELKLTPPEVG